MDRLSTSGAGKGCVALGATFVGMERSFVGLVIGVRRIGGVVTRGWIEISEKRFRMLYCLASLL